MTKGEFSPDSLYMYAYGVWLMHGGDPDRFEELSVDQVQILITSYLCTQRRIMNGQFKMMKAMVGIKDGN